MSTPFFTFRADDHSWMVIHKHRLLTKLVDNQPKIGHCFLVMKNNLKNITSSIITSTEDVEVNERGIIIVTSDEYPTHYVSIGLDISGVVLSLHDETTDEETVIYRTTDIDVKDMMSEDFTAGTTVNGIVVQSDDIPFTVEFIVDGDGNIKTNVVQI